MDNGKNLPLWRYLPQIAVDQEALRKTLRIINGIRREVCRRGKQPRTEGEKYKYPRGGRNESVSFRGFS